MYDINTTYGLSEEVLNRIRAGAFQAEKDGQLHPEQLDAIYHQRLFKMFVPKSLGGLELSLPEVLRLEEALAWADGSTAWVVTLCSGAGWFVGFINPGLVEKIFTSDRVCLAGSGATTGTASVTADGYVINGEWKYASGALHATMMTANCIIVKDGKTLLNEGGTPLVKSFILRKDEVELQRNWSSMGMVATASHGFKVTALHVPAERSFIIQPDKAELPNAVYHYPFLQLAETTLAVNFLGMAQRFLELFDERLQGGIRSRGGQNSNAIALHAEMLRVVQKKRIDFYQAVDMSWSYCTRREPIPAEALNAVSTSSRDLYRACLSVTSTLYPYAGLTAADPRTEINRVWRNFYTASQHSLFIS
jgi:indole-3-acetate monooxygenase